MSDFLWALWDRFVLFLAALNPSTAAKVEKLQADAVVLEVARKRLLAEIEASKQENAGLVIVKAVNAAETRRLEDEITQTKATLEKRITELDALSTDDRVRVDL